MNWTANIDVLVSTFVRCARPFYRLCAEDCEGANPDTGTLIAAGVLIVWNDCDLSKISDHFDALTKVAPDNGLHSIEKGMTD